MPGNLMFRNEAADCSVMRRVQRDALPFTPISRIHRADPQPDHVSPPLRLLVWSSIPTHHQSAFFRALRDRGIDVVVHYLDRVGAERLALGWDAHPALPDRERHVARSLRALDECPDWRERIHIVPGYNSVFLLRLAWFLSQQKVPWVHWSEHSWPRLRALVTFAVKRCYGFLADRYALGALAIGELARREFVRWGIRRERIRFLPYAVPGFGGETAARRDAPAAGVRFMFLGQFCARKGTDLLLRAMREVLVRHPTARLDLFGADRSGGAYQRKARQLGIADAVSFRGAVPAAHAGDVLQRCDVFVLPSRHDGWGVVLNEAASLGKPIIASDACGSAYHLALPGVNGFRVPVDDVGALAAAMRAYCEDPQLVVKHGTESLRLFKEFTPARNARRLEEALLSLL